MTGVDIVLIAVLIAMFVVATKWPVNIGLLGLAGAFIIGEFFLGMDEKEILKEFPSSILVTILGVTYFFSLAQKNGTIDYLVHSMIKSVGGRTAVVPWIFFLVASVLTALGTFSPAAVALLAPAAMSFSARTGFSPVVTGALVINGAHAGGFSPISVSGNIVTNIASKHGVSVDAIGLCLASYAINLMVSILTVVVMKLIGRLHSKPEGHVLDPTTQMGVVVGEHRLTPRIILTLALMVVMIIAAVVFSLPIGFVGIVVGVILSFTMMQKSDSFVSGISWSTILLVSGMMVYVSLMVESGVIDNLSTAALALGAPLVVGMLLCLIVGFGSAFASSTALITALIPMAIPLIQESSLSATAVLSAIAISATIVDVSPLSTDGALVIASTQGKAKATIWRNLVIYAVFVVALAPVLSWFLLVPTHII